MLYIYIIYIYIDPKLDWHKRAFFCGVLPPIIDVSQINTGVLKPIRFCPDKLRTETTDDTDCPMLRKKRPAISQCSSPMVTAMVAWVWYDARCKTEHVLECSLFESSFRPSKLRQYDPVSQFPAGGDLCINCGRQI